MKSKKILFKLKIKKNKKEYKINQVSEIDQIHRFAEFGRLSSGLFHDLVNPLTTVMLNINKIQGDCLKNPHFNSIKSDLEQVVKASEIMKKFIDSVRRQISPQGKKEYFCLNQEIEEAILVLNYKTRKNQIQLSFLATEKIIINGDPIRFNQIATNLISNAIDAYDKSKNTPKEIKIKLEKKEHLVKLIVSDHGSGIANNLVGKIFEPFFTTKLKNESLGLGLSLIKKIVEDDFSGKIKVSSEYGKGTIFTVIFPINLYDNQHIKNF